MALCRWMLSKIAEGSSIQKSLLLASTLLSAVIGHLQVSSSHSQVLISSYEQKQRMEVAPTPSPNSNLCDECGLNASKYRCPGCSIRSCSLPCVNSHKKRTSCTGKRPRTQIVPLSQFDDNLLISDYNFLEEAKRIAESAQRMRQGLCRNSYFKLPPWLRNLKNAAARRKTQLLFLPSGMSKREKNRTRYNQRKKSIFWTIEWRFHSTDVVLIDNRVDENASLCPIIEKHIKPGPWNDRLKSFREEQLDSLKFFIRTNAKGVKSPFRELDIKAPISQQFVNVVIVEYPIIHVFLPATSFNFEIIKDAVPLPEKSESKEPLNENLRSPKGVLFREEEIEDDMSADPSILDLMKQTNGQLADSSHFTNMTQSSSKELKGKNEVSCGSSSMEFGDADYFGFGFDKDSRDDHSGLMGQVDSNDFLDLEGFVQEGPLVHEELEEGEIPTD